MGPDSLAVLGRSDRPVGKRRPGPPAATRAGIDKAPVFGDFDERFRQIEHLTPLDPHSHRRALGAAAMATGRSLVRHDPVGLGDLAKGFALVPLSGPRSDDPRAREGSPASFSTHRSTAVANSSNCPSPAAGEAPHSQPATLPPPAQAMQSEPPLPVEESSRKGIMVCSQRLPRRPQTQNPIPL